MYFKSFEGGISLKINQKKIKEYFIKVKNIERKIKLYEKNCKIKIRKKDITMNK